MKIKYPAVCPFCGGRIVAEFSGNYGDAFYINKNGTVSRRRARRFMYELDNDSPQVYCMDCRRDPADYSEEEEDE